ncbi:MAG TPA: COX15/CtaA family protein, partial [Thermoanaerobaculia bacterium]
RRNAVGRRPRRALLLHERAHDRARGIHARFLRLRVHPDEDALAGLAIPDFPTFFDSWLPSLSVLSRPGVPIHLAHRLGAVVIVLLVARAALALSRLPAFFGTIAAAWAGLVCLQALLGALSIWSHKAVPLTTAHLATGALCWVTGVLALACLGACRNPSNALSSARRA